MDEQYARRRAAASKKRRHRKLRRRCIAGILLVAFMGFTCHAFASMLLVTDNTASADMAQKKLKTSQAMPVTTGNGIGIPDNSDWKLVLVNPWNKLPDNFSIENTTLKSRQILLNRYGLCKTPGSMALSCVTRLQKAKSPGLAMNHGITAMLAKMPRK